MNPKFNAAVHQKDDVSFVKISGVIDEDNELGSLADRLNPGTAIIDLSEIDRINSCGVRDWVNWLGAVEKKGNKIVLVECSPSIVSQINLVSNFTGGGVVKSFYAPYFCPNCDREKVLLVETRDMAGNSPFKAPTCRCDECDGVMDFDDMEDSFFAFLGNAKKIVTDDKVEAVISEFTPGNTGEAKIRLRTGVSNPGSLPTPSSTGTGTGMPANPSTRSQSTNTGSFPTGKSQVTGSGQKWPLNAAPEDQSRRLVPPTTQPRSMGAWILVGMLVLAAIGLLGYVFLYSGTGNKGPEKVGAGTGSVHISTRA